MDRDGKELAATFGLVAAVLFIVTGLTVWGVTHIIVTSIQSLIGAK